MRRKPAINVKNKTNMEDKVCDTYSRCKDGMGTAGEHWEKEAREKEEVSIVSHLYTAQITSSTYIYIKTHRLKTLTHNRTITHQ